MKKRIFAGIIVLLALAAAGCGGVLGEPEAETEALPKIVGHKGDGRAIMELTIGGREENRGRALTGSRAGVDFYEAVFFDGVDTYRTTWDYAGSGTIQIPTGDYAAAPAKAYLFAGNGNTKTLRYVGKITDTVESGTPSGGTTVSVDTTAVEFTLHPLLNDISAAVDTSTFNILASAGAPAAGSTLETTTTPANPEYDGVPIYTIDENVTDATATYTIDIGTNGDETPNHYAGIYMLNTPANLDAAFRFTDSTYLNKLATPTPVMTLTNPSMTSGGSNNSTANEFPDNGEFNMTFTTPATPAAGFVQISLELPVNAVNTAANPFPWYIRGGTANSNLDHGKAALSTGGAILLGIGDVKAGWATVVLPVSP